MNEVCTSYGSTPSVCLSAPVLHRIVSKSYTLKMRAVDRAAFADQLEFEDCVFCCALKAGDQLRFAHALQRQQRFPIPI